MQFRIPLRQMELSFELPLWRNEIRQPTIEALRLEVQALLSNSRFMTASEHSGALTLWRSQ